MPVPQKQVTTQATGTITCNDSGVDQLLILNSGLIAAITIVLPATPVDGQRVFCKTKGGVTLLTLTAGGNTVGIALGTLAVGVSYIWTFNIADTTWY